MAPLVTVVLPFQNAAPTLPECLDSIAAQTWPNLEVLAINDGSTDASAVIVAAYAARDPRFQLCDPGARGLVAALNYGITMAHGVFVARMDADDRMVPQRLAAQVALLSQQPNLVLCGTQVELFSAGPIHAGYHEYVRWQNQCITPEQIANNIYVEAPLAHPSVMFRRSLFDTVGGYHAGPFPEDYQLWLRIHEAGLAMGKVAEVLLEWRDRPERTSRTDPRYARSAFDQLRTTFLARDPRLQTGRPLVFWGSGRATRQRVKLLLNHGFQPAAWIDVDPDKFGHTIWGAAVHERRWLRQNPRPFVLVYVASHGARNLISGWLAEMEYQVGVDYLMVG
jgi:glycosyltransferase involved in cell wall biosynthesis